MERLILSGNILLNDDNEIYLLFRTKHKHFETPGGKLEKDECKNIFNPTRNELKEAAKRELLEEVKGVDAIFSMDYFDSVKFTIPDGRCAIAHKFITRFEGDIAPAEHDIFDKNKSKFFRVEDLDNQPISPDLALLLPKLKERFYKNI